MRFAVEIVSLSTQVCQSASRHILAKDKNCSQFAMVARVGGRVRRDRLWKITGLCRDLDFFTIIGRLEPHGLMTAQWRAGQLPDEALRTIAAHDHRSGIQSNTLIAVMYRQNDWPRLTQAGWHRRSIHLRRHLVHQQTLDILDRHATKHDLSVRHLSISPPAGSTQERVYPTGKAVFQHFDFESTLSQQIGNVQILAVYENRSALPPSL
jgi:hypothetical protein